MCTGEIIALCICYITKIYMLVFLKRISMFAFVYNSVTKLIFIYIKIIVLIIGRINFIYLMHIVFPKIE